MDPEVYLEGIIRSFLKDHDLVSAKKNSSASDSLTLTKVSKHIDPLFYLEPKTILSTSFEPRNPQFADLKFGQKKEQLSRDDFQKKFGQE